MYEEDRKRLNAFTYAVPQPPPCTPCPDTPISQIVSPPAGTPTLGSRLKPIKKLFNPRSEAETFLDEVSSNFNLNIQCWHF